MRVTKSLPDVSRVSNFSKPLLWATLVCAMFLNASAVSPQQMARNSADSEQSTQDNTDVDQLRKSVQRLTAEVDQLRKKVAELDKYRQIDYVRDLLMKEEQRAEVLQNQLLDVSEKESALQSRIDQLDEQLRPENINQALAGVGSLRPEEAREALRRKLSSEKRRLQAQFDLLRQDHLRLQASLATADASIQRLRLRLNEATRP